MGIGPNGYWTKWYWTKWVFEEYSQRSAYVAFWRKLFFGQYEYIIDRSLFWQNFRLFDPSPVGVTHE